MANPILTSHTKTCNQCKAVLPVTDFHKKKSGKYGVAGRCKKCLNKISADRYYDVLQGSPSYIKRVKEYAHGWHLKNKERNNERSRTNDQLKRRKCLEHYGLSCECCGESAYEFLVIDHINGGGYKHRKEEGPKTYRWLIKNGMPTGFRTLCWNCNSSLGAYNYCPHQAGANRLRKIEQAWPIFMDLYKSLLQTEKKMGCELAPVPIRNFMDFMEHGRRTKAEKN